MASRSITVESTGARALSLALDQISSWRRRRSAQRARKPTRVREQPERGSDEVEFVVFTSRFSEEDFEDIDGLRLSPMVFQEEVEKAVELRVTVVGDQLFVASVDASRFDGAKVDWRRAAYDVAVEFERDTLPDEVAGPCSR